MPVPAMAPIHFFRFDVMDLVAGGDGRLSIRMQERALFCRRSRRRERCGFCSRGKSG